MLRAAELRMFVVASCTTLTLHHLHYNLNVNNLFVHFIKEKKSARANCNVRCHVRSICLCRVRTRPATSVSAECALDRPHLPLPSAHSTRHICLCRVRTRPATSISVECALDRQMSVSVSA
ncbi:hypothetical protein RR48_08267 [Papilio machaon]|uniref:Uncharacterized protein n=1 Tax=Papilio machaon TaxID=76193 RepID=A0A194RFA0_PAPMA|nr:hypothetical protein RR48_08267 [Papilio machaon]